MSDPNTQFLSIPSSRFSERVVAYDLYKGSQEKTGIYWLSGFKSSMRSNKVTELASWCSQNNHSLCRFDYSGHGESPGNFEDGLISHWLEEAICIFESKTNGPQILIGSSMGGWLTLLLLRQLKARYADLSERVKGCILIAPAWNMTEELMWGRFSEEIKSEILKKGAYMRPSAYGDGPYAITRGLIEDGRMHSLDLSKVSLDCPIRIIHGLQDPDVPWEHSLELVKQIKDNDITLHLIKDGEHRLSRPEDLDKLYGLLNELL